MNNPTPKYECRLSDDGGGYWAGSYTSELYPRLTSGVMAEFFPWTGPAGYEDRGIYVHSCFEALIDEELDYDRVEPKYVGYVDAIRSFLFSVNPTFVAREISLWHPWGYGTTIDSVAMLSEKRRIIELKTGGMEHVCLQLAGQTLAWEANFPTMPVDEYAGYCLKVDNDGSYKLHEIALVEALADFAALMRLYNYKRKVNKCVQ